MVPSTEMAKAASRTEFFLTKPPTPVSMGGPRKIYIPTDTAIFNFWTLVEALNGTLRAAKRQKKVCHKYIPNCSPESNQVHPSGYLRCRVIDDAKG
jgi:hypothetical protein